jgi:SNF2 family DNA or RNA helicase
MAENLLHDEFGGSSSELFHLGVVAFDERALSDAVLSRAQTKALTGISTSASLEVCEALLSRTRSDVQRLESLPSRNAETNMKFDDLRIKEQLLIKLVNSKRPSTAPEATTIANKSSGIKRPSVLSVSSKPLVDFQGVTSPSQQTSSVIKNNNNYNTAAAGDQGKKSGRGLTVKFAESPLVSQSSSFLQIPQKLSSMTPLQLVADAFSKPPSALSTSSSSSSSSSSLNNRFLNNQSSLARPQIPSITAAASSRASTVPDRSKSPNVIPHDQGIIGKSSSKSSLKSSSSTSIPVIVPFSSPPIVSKETNVTAENSTTTTTTTTTTKKKNEDVVCPVCSRTLGSRKSVSDSEINNHIDRCLRRCSSTHIAPSTSSSTSSSGLFPSKEDGENEVDEEEDGIFTREDDADDSSAPRSDHNRAATSSAIEIANENEDEKDDDDGEDVVDISAVEDDDEDLVLLPSIAQPQKLTPKASTSVSVSSSRGKVSRSEAAHFAIIDDWEDAVYDHRQVEFKEEMRRRRKADKKREKKRKRRRDKGDEARDGVEDGEDVGAEGEEEDDEDQVSGDSGEDPTLPGGLTVPKYIFEQLLPYQIDGLSWFWGLHKDRVGGILGDEMGLGKTVQTVALLGSLHRSGLLKLPSLLLCPATIVGHWVRELTSWWPPLRVIVLHDSGSAFRSSSSSSSSSNGAPKNADQTRNRIIKAVFDRKKKCDVIITTYEGLKSSAHLLLPQRWAYAILDEGHKIRNPDSAAALIVKQLSTPHRIILSGAPIQNKLRELWSLMDFCFPGRLGSLPMFEAQFAVPIAAGGWSHASAVAVHTAYECAVILRDLISPHLLRRLKKDVNTQLPTKTEQVLFCRLAPAQRDLYLRYLRSREVSDVLAGSTMAFRAITILRKICNHPTLLDKEEGQVFSSLSSSRADLTSEASLVRDSGKMAVVAEILKLWKREGHRGLLFAQGRQTLDLLESLCSACGFSYLRMDGTTPVRSRQSLVDAFNSGVDQWFVFLLTTRVGGVGINLIGADRVLIYDPDWNPTTDIQARERAWRLGQKKHVTIYRLLIAGTIEEKIYHRQIFKTALSQRVLSDPKSKRLFSYEDLRDLFSLTDDSASGPGGSFSSSSSSGSSGHHSSSMKRRTSRSGITATDLFLPEGSMDLEEGEYKSSSRSSPIPEETSGFINNEGDQSDDASVLNTMEMISSSVEFNDGDGNKSKKPSAVKAGGGGKEESSPPSQTAILQALVDRGGLSSVFSHDAMEALTSGGPSSSSAQQYAKRIAKNALENLRKADEEHQRARKKREAREELEERRLMKEKEDLIAAKINNKIKKKDTEKDGSTIPHSLPPLPRSATSAMALGMDPDEVFSFGARNEEEREMLTLERFNSEEARARLAAKQAEAARISEERLSLARKAAAAMAELKASAAEAAAKKVQRRLQAILSVLIDVHDDPKTIPPSLDGNLYFPLGRSAFMKAKGRESIFVTPSYERFRERRAITWGFTDVQRHHVNLLGSDADISSAEVKQDDLPDTLSVLQNLPSTSSSSSSSYAKDIGTIVIDGNQSKLDIQVKKSSTINGTKTASTKQVESGRENNSEVRVLRRLPRGLIRFYRPRFLRSTMQPPDSSSSSSSSTSIKIDPLQIDITAEILAAKRLSENSSTLAYAAGTINSSSSNNNNNVPRPLSSQYLLARLRSLHAPVYGEQAASLAAKQREEANAKKARPVRAPPPLAVDSQGRTFGGLLQSAAESAANAAGVYRVPGFN